MEVVKSPGESIEESAKRVFGHPSLEEWVCS